MQIGRISRRSFMQAVGTGCAYAALPTTFAAPASGKQPNIILFLVDDMGLMDTSCPMLTDEDGKPKRYPLNDWYRTPNMEKLAEKGIRFSNFYAHSVCSPTRVSVMTGQNSARHGSTTWINPTSNNRGQYGPPDWNWTGIDKDDTTLPRLLHENGYRTIHVGKAHFGPKGHFAAEPENIGFDVNIGGTYAGRPKSYYSEDWYGNKKKDLRAVPDLEEYHDSGIYLTEALTREANKAVADAVADGKPFFLNMSHYAVHSPFQPDPRFADHYKDSGKSKQAQAYATMIEGIDKSLGDIIAEIRKLGVGDNTLIIFYGDNGSDAPLGNAHGYTSSAPLLGKKGTHHEGGMRVPFIAAWVEPEPQNPWQKRLPIKAGAVQQQMGTILDLMPTICSLTGTIIPSGYRIDGVDLATQLSGHRNPARPETFLNHFPHQHRSSYYTSFVDGDWKTVYHYPVKEGPHYELFNLKQDPFERNNVADKNPERLRTMAAEMLKDMEAKGALYPVKDGKEMKPIMP